jgi:tRNA(Met) cytidine acetyltransferase
VGMPASFTNQLDAAMQQSARSRQRVCLRLSGPREAVRLLADELAARYSRVPPLRNTDPEGLACTLQQLTTALGGTCQTLIIDTFAGLDPDSTAMLCGTLCGGGLLILLTPAFADWPGFDDPMLDRLAVYPTTRRDVTRRYVTRLTQQLGSLAPQQQLGSIDVQLITASDAPDSAPPVGPTADQRDVIDAILHLAQADSAGALLVHADRGRGKSSALGMAIQHLREQNPELSISLTAPNRRSASQVFAYAGSTNLHFEGPDELLLSEHTADLLLIDEAAALPLPVLQQLARKFPRVVFASTLHGYEGAGRGFALRFEDFLTKANIPFEKRHLRTPIRYAEGDWLEQAVVQIFMPESDITPASTVPEAAALTFHALDRDQLLTDENRLAQLFGLLVDAHYQTRPLDLQHLLDGPNIALFTLQDGPAIIAAAWIALEGPISDTSLQHAILDGQRRPRGHLLPQRLAYEHMETRFLDERMARVVRIAVQPDFQNSGYGRHLLSQIEEHCRLAQIDAIGSVFGDTPRLARFWHSQGFSTLHLGHKPNAASGEGSRLVLKALTPRPGDAFERARQRAEVKQLASRPDAVSVMPGYALEIRRFFAGTRSLDASRLALHAFAIQLISAGKLTTRDLDQLKVLVQPLNARKQRRLSGDIRAQLLPFVTSLPD